MQAVGTNLVAGWVGIVLGFLSGLLLGSGFHREEWLGGYASLKRRLYRLGHISFFGLAAANLLFYFTVKTSGIAGNSLTIASRCFIVGAIAMPVCCVIMAHRPALRLLFAIPVVSLLAGAILTLWKVME